MPSQVTPSCVSIVTLLANGRASLALRGLNMFLKNARAGLACSAQAPAAFVSGVAGGVSRKLEGSWNEMVNPFTTFVDVLAMFIGCVAFWW